MDAKYEALTVKLLAMTLNAQNLHLQAMRLTSEMQELVDQHLETCGLVIAEVDTFLSANPNVVAAPESCEGDVHGSTCGEP